MQKGYFFGGGRLQNNDLVKVSLLFPLDAFDRLQRGLRLHHDLGINWQGVSVALGLLERIEELEQQVHYLSNQPGE